MKILIKSLIVFFLLFISFSLFIFTFQNVYLPEPDLIGKKIINKGLEIYDRTGNILIYKQGFKNSWIDFNDIPEHVIKTILIAEDQDFYSHKGISLKGILRSIYLNLKNKNLEYGGSTITQQLVRNLFLTKEKTLSRKLKEIILALKIEKKYSKNQILTYYLNSIYYGEGVIGIKSAAEYYFNKNLKDLTLSEAAILASIPKAPAFYAPVNQENLNRLKKRRDYILTRLKEEGWINQKDYQLALEEEIKIVKQKYIGMLAPHFVIKVIKELKSKFPDLNLEETNLKIISTLDYDLQKIAEKAVKEGAKRNKEKYNGNNAALVAINPKNGEVLALVGSADFFDENINGQVNMVYSYRQPGSAFKPLVYTTLFELGYPDKTIIFDVPTDFGNYKPKNFDKKFKGPVTLRQSLAESRNIPSVKVFYLAGPEKVINLAKKFGMTYLKDWQNYGLSLALGTAEVRMIDLIKFYSALANDGKLVSQTLILKIIKDKKIVYEYKPQEEQIISPQTARILNDILKDVEARKGLLQSSLNLTIFNGYEVALKTGTTQFYQDAWTFGYTPNIVVGIWAGNTDGRRMNSLGASLVAALPIFHQFLNEAINFGKIQPENFIPPEERIVDKPMLNGNFYSDYGIHNILFFVDKNNPLGPIPENPDKDPQFKNWEEGVLNFINQNF